MCEWNGERVRGGSMGRYPGLSAADARDKIKIAAGDLAKKGVDPAATKSQHRTARSIGDLAAEYLTKHAMVKKKSWRAGEWELKKENLPARGGRFPPAIQHGRRVCPPGD